MPGHLKLVVGPQLLHQRQCLETSSAGVGREGAVKEEVFAFSLLLQALDMSDLQQASHRVQPTALEPTMEVSILWKYISILSS